MSAENELAKRNATKSIERNVEKANMSNNVNKSERSKLIANERQAKFQDNCVSIHVLVVKESSAIAVLAVLTLLVPILVPLNLLYNFCIPVQTRAIPPGLDSY